YPTVGFASQLTQLSNGDSTCSPPDSGGACLIDTVLAAGTKSGYVFTMTGVTGTPAATYQVIATPQTPNQTGVRSFCSFADAVVRANTVAITTCDTTQNPLQ
ncbi:MAG: pili assembly chaperone, partial [Terriglobales bacterium]